MIDYLENMVVNLHLQQGLNKYASAKNNVGKIRKAINLYDQIIFHLTLAKQAIGAKDLDGRYENITKASDIATKLLLAIDPNDNSKEITLFRTFYKQMILAMQAIVINNQSSEEVDKIIELVKKIRETFNSMDTAPSES